MTPTFWLAQGQLFVLRPGLGLLIPLKQIVGTGPSTKHCLQLWEHASIVGLLGTVFPRSPPAWLPSAASHVAKLKSCWGSIPSLHNSAWAAGGVVAPSPSRTVGGATLPATVCHRGSLLPRTTMHLRFLKSSCVFWNHDRHNSPHTP